MFIITNVIWHPNLIPPTWHCFKIRRPLHLKSMKPFSFTNWDSSLCEAVATLHATLPPIRHINLPLEILKENQKSSEQIAARLGTLIQNHVFKNDTEEIVFFKAVKPLALELSKTYGWVYGDIPTDGILFSACPSALISTIFNSMFYLNSYRQPDKIFLATLDVNLSIFSRNLSHEKS
jgi:hypothetical protein